MGVLEGLGNFTASLVASVILIFLGVAYFGITLWIIKAASDMFFGPGLEANWAVLSASLMAVGAILAGTIERE